MTADLIRIASTFPEPFRLMIRESVGSTNDELRVLAQAGEPDGLVLLARHQTAGRGRRGAAWFYQPDVSLAFSILVRPKEARVLWPRLALATGLAVAEALESFGVAVGIKWPNDLWVGGRKVAGLLAESGADSVIIGIGLNVNTRVFPPEVASLATSLRLEIGNDLPRAEVLGAILHQFALRRDQIGVDFALVLDGIRERCVLVGHRVSLETAQGRRVGLVEGLGAGGELLLRTDAGLEAFIQAHEVRLLPED
jgi:BirA family biotin operon repressor/biotin-[acetyl-CoA-carboxylase] ligase